MGVLLWLILIAESAALFVVRLRDVRVSPLVRVIWAVALCGLFSWVVVAGQPVVGPLFMPAACLMAVLAVAFTGGRAAKTGAR